LIIYIVYWNWNIKFWFYRSKICW